jgi:HAD domain in Swiss Army Knife RNA repair proteins
MKILFLDIDGVLNSEESFHINHELRMEDCEKRGEGAEFLKQYCWPLGHLYTPLIERLNKIIEATQCKIVISSTWRISSTPQEITNYLTQKGFKYGESIIDRTGQDSKNARGGEIQNWLDEHKNVKTYVILDDDSADIVGDYTTKKHPNNFVKTDFIWGLQDKQVEEVVKILNQ